MNNLLRSPALKFAFLGVALAGAAAAVVLNWTEVREAASGLSLSGLAVAGILSTLYVFATMLSWRSVMRDLGAPLSVHEASRLFFVSQIGKYIPGGIWNVVAVSELGREVGVARRTSLSGMLVFWLVSVASGLVTGTAYLLGSGTVGERETIWLVLLLPVALILLAPPVLRLTLRVMLRLLRRDPLVQEPTWNGLLKATTWAMAGWGSAGLQVWLLAKELSDRGDPGFFAALGGYALAWTAGFLVVFAPAGAGVREVVLGGLLSDSLTVGAVIALVLLSRLLITVADVALAGVFTLWRTRDPRP